MNNSIYNKLNIRPVINAAGTYTKIGGSIMSEQTIRDMADAARSHVDIKELQTIVNERLAKLTKNEAAAVCNGAAAGLYLATASCLSLKSGKSISELSIKELGDYEIIMFTAHRIPYDWSIRQLGVKIQEVGMDDEFYTTTENDLLNAINEKTAGVFFVFSNRGGWIPEGGLTLETTIALAKEKNIPVIVDAAAQVPPVENLWNFTEKGATAALFSGGKDLRGPQSSGLVVGDKDFISKFIEINFFNYGIGRMLKTGREEIVGLLSAVEQYINMNHEERNRWVEYQIELLIQFSNSSKVFKILRTFPNEAGQPMARAEIFLKNDYVELEFISESLIKGNPSIYTFVDEGRLFINPMTLYENETEIIISRLEEIETDIFNSIVG